MFSPFIVWKLELPLLQMQTSLVILSFYFLFVLVCKINYRTDSLIFMDDLGLIDCFRLCCEQHLHPLSSRARA